MESSLPFAVRVAVGVVSESLGALRRLPTDVSTLPVTVLGKVAKLSFQLNQQLTDLATSGDHLLATLQRPAEPPERTAWSTIDDEDEVAAKDPQAAATWEHVEDAAAGVRIDDDETGATSSDASESDDETAPDGDAQPLRDTATTVQAAAAAARRRSSSARRSSASRDAAAAQTSFDAAEDEVAEADSLERGLLDDVDALENEQVRPVTLIGLPSNDGPTTDGSSAEVAELTLAELRSRVRSMPVEQVRAALEHEQVGKARPAFLTLLTNRLSTLARGGE